MWQEEASCRGVDVNLFIIVDQDHPEATGLDDRARKALTMVNFKKAESICADCPVRAVCEESMTEDDRAWTFRAGLWPSKFTVRVAGRPRRDVAQDKSDKFKACELHNNKGSDGRCLTCKAESRKRFRDSHASRVGRGAWSRPDGTCQRGHNEWDTAGRCLPCRLESQALSSAKRAESPCPQGHFEWDRFGRCLPCRRESDRLRKAKSRAAQKAARVVQS